MPVGIRPRGGPLPGTNPEAPTVPRPAPMPPIPPIDTGNMGLHGVAPVMISSLPLMASGDDVYMRQFYRSFRVPSRRYLPVRSQ